MSDVKDDGGPAFPDPARAGGHCMDTGMSLRDWFAGQALTGDLSNPEGGTWDNDVDAHFLKERAILFYRIADAMIAARK